MNLETLRHRMVPLRESGRFSAPWLDTFEAWIAGADEAALFRVNPVAFARAHGVAEPLAIDLFVHATRAGIFDFNWGLICPTCFGFITTPGGLRSLANKRQCAMCQVDAGSYLDDGVEVSFTVNPAIRPLRFHGAWSALAPRPDGHAALIDDALRLYFSHAMPAESGITEIFRRSVVSLGVLPRATPLEVRFDLDPSAPGELRLVAPALHAVANLTVDPNGASTASVHIDDGRAVPETVALRPGPVALTLTQSTDLPELLFALFRLDFDAAGPVPHGQSPFGVASLAFLSGKRLLSNQSFRELFRTETLPPDGALEIRALAMLFTDLKASTQLYERVGDLRALALVREHFELLREVVDAHQGAVVKTIGDAVMATFADPVSATHAAVAMHRALEKVPELELKVGLHQGPCVAVDSNARLDYFGQTVNIAARVQGLADGREVVLTDAVLQSPGVSQALAQAGLPLSAELATLKGIDLPVAVHRAKVA